MIIGDPSIFAIESSITQAFERLCFRALGFFVIHLGGRRYGVYEPDATMLACSFSEVERRISGRGTHTVPFATDVDAGQIAEAFRNALYAEEQDEDYFGVSRLEFVELVHSKNLTWAPDGDEAFDDGSYVLQFDVEDRVRLIGFKSHEGGGHDPATLSDVWLIADAFYGVLQSWHDSFADEWAGMWKVFDGQ